MIPGALSMMSMSRSAGIPMDYIARYVSADITGTTLVDKTGNYNGTLVGAVKLGGKLLHFDGVDDYASLSALLAKLQTCGSGTIAMHFKAPAGGAGYFSIANSAQDTYVQFGVFETAMTFSFRKNGAGLGVDNFYISKAGIAPALNQYHTAVFVHDAVVGCKLYLDGVEQVPNDSAGTANDKWWDDITSDNARVMSLDYSATDRFYTGDFVSLTFYDYAVGAEGIARLSSEPNPVGGALFGDSITVGVGATTYENSWAGKFLGDYAVTNYAVSGDQAGDQSAKIQTSFTRVPSDIYTLIVGTNDHRTYKTDTAKKAAFKAFYRQCLAWMALPVKKFARTGMTITGTWSDTGVNTFGKNTSQLGAKASATFNGTGVIVGTILQDSTSAASTVTVKIDGVSVGSFSCNVAMTTVNGLTYAPAALYFGGLANTSHTIELENTVSGKIFYLDYIAETNQVAPDIVVGNIIEMSAAGYSTYGTSQANVIAYNTMIADVVGEFATEGITIPLVDLYSSVNPATQLSDGVHPNDTGHAIIYTNMKAAFPV